MELETLEVLLDINTERVQKSLERVMPKIENAMTRIQQQTGITMDKTEKNMDISKASTDFIKNLEKMEQAMKKNLAHLEKATKSTSESVEQNLSTGVRKARPKVSKEIDMMVNDINSKMGRAKAAQEKIAYLSSQRQSAFKSGDTGKIIYYDEQIARTQSQMIKFRDQAKGLGNAMKSELNEIPSSLDTIANSMSKNEAKIESLRKNINSLRATYNDQLASVGSFSSGFKGYADTKMSSKTSGELSKQSERMEKLIASNDRLQKEYAQTEDRAKSLRNALTKINTSLGTSSIQTGNAATAAQTTRNGLRQSERAIPNHGGVATRMSNAVSHGMKKIKSGFQKSMDVVKKFGSLFSRTANKVSSGQKRMTVGNSAFGSSVKQIARYLIVYQLISNGIRALATNFVAALKTNDQFASSLNQIKVNLLTAFYPIYTAILPAINALMSAVAQLTGQLASFIAMIFGSTYDAAKQGASGLYDNVQALQDTGGAASKTKEKVDKLKKSLMGFDEINTLDLQTEDDDSASSPDIDFAGATGSYTTPKWMTDMQKILKDFFKPFIDAWKNQGKKVIDAWKYALGEVIGLASAIGKSFMEVWTNGTGQRFIENLLILLADILNIIGDVAGAFRRAWEDNGRGTALIQSIFNALNEILELLHSIATAFRNAWNDDGLGESIAANILEIFTHLFTAIGNIADQFKKAWDEGARGESIFKTILGIINDLLGNINGMAEATSIWTAKLDFSPLLESIDVLLKSIQPLTQNIGDGLEWFYKNVLLPLAGFVIEDVIPAFINILSSALQVLNAIIEALKPMFTWLWDNFLLPVSTWTGGIIVDVLNNIADQLSTLGEWIKDHSEIISNFALIIGAFGAAFVIVNAAITVWNVVAGIATGVTTAFGVAIAFLTSPIGIITIAIAAVIAVGILLWKNWDTIKEKAGQLASWLSEKWDGIKQSVSNAFTTIKDIAMETFNNVIDWATNIGKKIGKGLTQGVESVKNGAKNIFNGLMGIVGSGVNGVIKGINWVLSKVGAGKNVLSEWKIPSYSNGTNGHPGGLAMVNDGLGAHYREAFQMSDGQTGIFPAKRNLLVNLPAGTSILNGRETATRYRELPAYKNGIGDWIKDKWDNAKEIISEMWSYISSPSKLLDTILSKFMDLSGAFEPALSIASGSAKTLVSGAYGWLTSKFTNGFANGGVVDEDDLYRLGEGNKKEMILPLTRPQRAEELIEKARAYMGTSNSKELTLPDIFRNTPTGNSISFDDKSTRNDTLMISGDGLEGLNNNLISALGSVIAKAVSGAVQEALSSMNPSGDGSPIEVILELDRRQFGSVVIKSINDTTQRHNRFPLNIPEGGRIYGV